eukprot:426683-Ditylum_brightwellii.AAC.1
MYYNAAGPNPGENQEKDLGREIPTVDTNDDASDKQVKDVGRRETGWFGSSSSSSSLSNTRCTNKTTQKEKCPVLESEKEESKNNKGSTNSEAQTNEHSTSITENSCIRNTPDVLSNKNCSISDRTQYTAQNKNAEEAINDIARGSNNSIGNGDATSTGSSSSNVSEMKVPEMVGHHSTYSDKRKVIPLRCEI